MTTKKFVSLIRCDGEITAIVTDAQTPVEHTNAVAKEIRGEDSGYLVLFYEGFANEAAATRYCSINNLTVV